MKTNLNTNAIIKKANDYYAFEREARKQINRELIILVGNQTVTLKENKNKDTAVRVSVHGCKPFVEVCNPMYGWQGVVGSNIVYLAELLNLVRESL